MSDRTPRAVPRAEFEGPDSLRAVYAWLDACLPFEPRPDQKPIRQELRSRISRLVAQDGEVLHARYAGPRHPASDIENLVLYNIDMDGGCFRGCARAGVRFELAPAAPRRPPSGRELPCAYAYGLVPADHDFAHWQQRRQIARFDAVVVEGGKGSLLSQTWLALQRADVDVATEIRAVEAPFAVTLTVRSPTGDVSRPSVPKSLIDGVVAAFHSHGDPSSLEAVASRVAESLQVGVDEVAGHLTRQERAVLGARPMLLWPRKNGVQWNPADDLCFAGEVLSGGYANHWILSGTISEIEAR